MKTTFQGFAVLCSLLAMACGGAGSISGNDDGAAPPVVLGAGAGMTGTWQMVQAGAGVTDLKMVLIEGFGGQIRGTWSATRTICGCSISGSVYSSNRVGTGVKIGLGIDANYFSYGELRGSTDGKIISGVLSFEYDGESRIEQGDVILSR